MPGAEFPRSGRAAVVGFRTSGLAAEEDIGGSGFRDGVGMGDGLPVSRDESTESRN